MQDLFVCWLQYVLKWLSSSRVIIGDSPLKYRRKDSKKERDKTTDKEKEDNKTQEKTKEEHSKQTRKKVRNALV